MPKSKGKKMFQTRVRPALVSTNRKPLTNQPVKGSIPPLRENANKGVARMKGKERIATINDDGEIRSVPLDYVTMASSALRISNMFPRYEQWFIHGMKFHYIPAVSMTQSGTVYMAPEYDPKDTHPGIVNTMLKYEGARSGPVSQRFTMNMPNTSTVFGYHLRPPLYTDPNSDSRLSQYGKLIWACDGTGGGVGTVGYIEMEYDISFIQPQAYDEVTISNLDDRRVYIKNQAVPASGFFPNSTSTVIGSLAYPELHIYDSAGGGTSTIATKAKYRATYEAGTATLKNDAGNTLYDGTNLFFDTPSQIYNESTSTWGPSAASDIYLGAMSYSGDFLPPHLIKVAQAAVDTYFILKDITKVLQ